MSTKHNRLDISYMIIFNMVSDRIASKTTLLYAIKQRGLLAQLARALP
jgi:hypothetical protein